LVNLTIPSHPTAGGYGPEGAYQYARFSRAFALDPNAAMKSASWGKFQIMEFNFAAASFTPLDAFVDAMKISEDKQLILQMGEDWTLT